MVAPAPARMEVWDPADVEWAQPCAARPGLKREEGIPPQHVRFCKRLVANQERDSDRARFGRRRRLRRQSRSIRTYKIISVQSPRGTVLLPSFTPAVGGNDECCADPRASRPDACLELAKGPALQKAARGGGSRTAPGLDWLGCSPCMLSAFGRRPNKLPPRWGQVRTQDNRWPPCRGLAIGLWSLTN